MFESIAHLRVWLCTRSGKICRVHLALRCLDGVERNLSSAVSNGVNSDADTHLGGRAYRLVHLLFRYGENAPVLWVSLEAVKHGRGLRA